MKSFKLVPLAAATSLALGLGLSGNAYAGTYAMAYDNIFNGLITVSDLIHMSFGAPAPTSACSAVLNGSGVANGGAGSFDCPIANAPGSSPTQTNNAFTPLGKTGTYAYGDAQIISEQSPGPNPTTIHAVNDAETHITGNGNSAAHGNNSSGTTLTIPITVTGGSGTVTFDFNADPFLEVMLQNTAGAGSQAQATLSLSLNIVNLANNATVFDWAPNGDCNGGVGACSNITGGTEFDDQATLNTNRITTTPGTDITYGTPTFPGTGTPGGKPHFRAVTFAILPGNYQLNLSMIEDVSALKVVPEPATLALMGVGLMGVGFMSRRKKQA